jgi:hypothetical protein
MCVRGRPPSDIRPWCMSRAPPVQHQGTILGGRLYYIHMHTSNIFRYSLNDKTCSTVAEELSRLKLMPMLIKRPHAVRPTGLAFTSSIGKARDPVIQSQPPTMEQIASPRSTMWRTNLEGGFGSKSIRGTETFTVLSRGLFSIRLGNRCR